MEGNRSRAQFLRDQRGAESVKLREFMKLFRVHGVEGVYCFVEGEDSKYYSIRIRAKYHSLEPNFINSGGKQSVLKLYEVITKKTEYNDARLLFFVDRDFDQLINNPDIYETPVYSIENFYTSLSCFSRILKIYFKLNEACDDFAVSIALFNRMQEKFHNAMLLINAWIAYQRDISNAQNTARLDLKDIDLDEFVTIKIDQVQERYNIEKIKEFFPNAIQVQERDLAEKIEIFKNQNKQEIFRGKYEIEFLRKFLEILRTEIGRKHSNIFKERKTISLQLSRKNLLSELGDCADISSCLVSYIEKMIEKRERQSSVAHGA